jgi:hypothetical protein
LQLRGQRIGHGAKAHGVQLLNGREPVAQSQTGTNQRNIWCAQAVSGHYMLQNIIATRD